MLDTENIRVFFFFFFGGGGNGVLEALAFALVFSVGFSFFADNNITIVSLTFFVW